MFIHTHCAIGCQIY